LGAHDFIAALEDEPAHLLESPVIEVLHDLDDRLLALTHGDEVELIDEGIGLAGRVGAADHGQRLSANLRRERERLVLHRDHAVDADDRGLQALDLVQHLAALQEGVVDMTHGVDRAAKGAAEVHQAERGHDPMPSLSRSALRIDEDNVRSFCLCHLASCTLMW